MIRSSQTGLVEHSISNLTVDVPLLRLHHGVTRQPQGQNGGRLTIAIEHAYAHGHWDIMLSQVKQYI
jgi:hypothetical protein